MKRLSIKLACVLLSLTVWSQTQAHNNNLATFHMVQSANDWVLEAHIARGTIDYAFAEAMESDDKVSIDQLKLWLANYLMESVNIVDDKGNRANLSIMNVSMGGHQCSLKFLVSGLNQGLTELDINLDSFSGNPHHANIVRVFYHDPEHENKLNKLKKALKNSNQYQHTFELGD